MRRARMRELAAEADARWEAKPRLADEAGVPNLPAPEGQTAGAASGNATRTGRGEAAAQNGDKGGPSDPWAQHRAQAPGEKWQPSAWNPSPTLKARAKAPTKS